MNNLILGGLEQQFPTDVPWQAQWCTTEFLKHAIFDYLIRSADLFPLRLSN